MEDDIRKFKLEHTDIQDAIYQLGIKYAKRSGDTWTISCLWHDEHTPSCSIYHRDDGTIGIHCFGCGYSGDLIDLTMKLKNCNITGAINFFNGKTPFERNFKTPESNVDLQYIYNNYTTRSIIEPDFLKRRRLNPEILDYGLCRFISSNGIAKAPRIIRYFRESSYNLAVPLYSYNGNFITFLSRYTGDANVEPKTRFIKGTKKRGLLMMNKAAIDAFSSNGADILYITEGEIDFLTLSGFVDLKNLPIVGLPGDGSLCDELYVQFDKFDKIVICADNDKAGNRYANQINNAIDAAKCYRLLLPEGKDLNDIANIIADDPKKYLDENSKLMKKMNNSSENSEEEKKTPKKKKVDMAYQVAMRVLEESYEDGEYLVSLGKDMCWRYDGICWNHYKEDRIKNDVLEEFLLDGEPEKSTASIISNATTIIKAKVSKYNGDLFSHENRSIINCRNCEIWIDDRSGKHIMKPHRHDSYLNSSIDVDFQEGSKCDLWLETLRGIFANHIDIQGTIEYLQELFGYTIQTNKNLASWVLFFGHGNNGKSLILQILERLLGKAALQKSINEFDPVKNKHCFSEVPGKLAIIDDDVQSRTVLPDGTMKKLSENKILIADGKWKDPIEFKSSAIIYLASNHWLNTRDLSNGMIRRANIFKFNRIFTHAEEDINRVTDISNNELSGVLNWALRGLDRLRQRGHFEPSIDCVNAKEEWISSFSQIKQFVSHICKQSANSTAEVNEVWQEYLSWSEDERIPSVARYSKSRFQTSMKECGYEVISAKAGLFDQRVKYYYSGIEIEKRGF